MTGAGVLFPQRIDSTVFKFFQFLCFSFRQITPLAYKWVPVRIQRTVQCGAVSFKLWICEEEQYQSASQPTVDGMVGGRDRKRE